MKKKHLKEQLAKLVANDWLAVSQFSAKTGLSRARWRDALDAGSGTQCGAADKADFGRMAENGRLAQRHPARLAGTTFRDTIFLALSRNSCENCAVGWQ